MQPLVEPIPESRLADVLMCELFPRQEIDDTFVDIVLDDLELGDPPEADYAVYEIIRDAFATTEFVRVRDTRYDHIVTVEFPREFAREVLGADTARAPELSAPYERIAIEPAESEEMQLELEDLEIEQDLFAKGDDASVGEESGARFMSYAQALPFPLYSAPFERVELGELPMTPALAGAGDSTDLIVPRRSASTRVVAIVMVLAVAAAATIGLALLVVRNATG